MSTKILALGDSWFHYPYSLDSNGNILLDPQPTTGVGGILKHMLLNHPELSNYLYYDETSTFNFIEGDTHNVVSTDDVLGCCGEEVLIMVNGNYPGAKTWLQLLTERVGSYAANYDTIIILLSGGGNDIAGQNLFPFLTQTGDNVNWPAIQDSINGKIKTAYATIVNSISSQFPRNTFHFVVHGYAYAPVNGKGLFFEDATLAQKLLHKLGIGPWLYPAFNQNNLLMPDLANRAYCQNIIWQFIDMFNAILTNLNINYPNANVHYVDLRGFTTKINPDNDWCNEIHFDCSTFSSASKAFYNVIQPLLRP